ncbi:OmpA family protein [Chitinophaga sp. Mgbs1]|uniref:OmpA family protein n=1 Tax=Chitinophaga solisilvae TaxID=1233460 RepID=A0A3S1AY31_9BACT|nr:OmpA family protein [Chitinophaga solisilvae]
MKCYIILATSLLLLCVNARAQTASRLLGRADKAYAAIRLPEAMRYYLQANAREPGNQYAIRQLALVAQELKYYQEALQWFQKTDFNQAPSSWLLLYAQALSGNEQYEKADSCLRAYQRRTASSGHYNFQPPDRLFRDSSCWQIDYLSVNSALDEFSPCMYGRNLVYVTNQQLPTAVKRVDLHNERPFLQLRMVPDTGIITYRDIRTLDTSRGTDLLYRYIVNDDDTRPTSNDSRTTGIYSIRTAGWKGIQRLNWNNGVNIFGKNIATRYNEGPVTFSPLFDTVYFTRNNFTGGSFRKDSLGLNRLKIYRAVYRNGDWIQITELPFNSGRYSAAHPALTPDGHTLYFASDMPGGFGGKDIYYVTRQTDGNWSVPVNAGPAVNTAGDEVFPYADNQQHLFFSSNGRAGLGGLDIYRIALVNNIITGEAVNPGYPLNTSRDDFGIWCTQDATGFHGFFSSNRYGDDDLLRFRWRQLSLQLTGSVFNRITGLRQAGATISLRSTDRQQDTLTTHTGNFSWQLQPSTDYEIWVAADGMKKQVIPFSTKGITNDSIIHYDIQLEPFPEAASGWRRHCDSLKKQYTVPDIYFHLDSYQIREDALPTLQRLSFLLRQDSTLTLIIRSYTDSRASTRYNNRLSAQRSAAVAGWLEQAGIAGSRLRREYFGETRLKNNCADQVPCPESLHQQNRRTEFSIVKNGTDILLECAGSQTEH